MNQPQLNPAMGSADRRLGYPPRTVPQRSSCATAYQSLHTNALPLPLDAGFVPLVSTSRNSAALALGITTSVATSDMASPEGCICCTLCT